MRPWLITAVQLPGQARASDGCRISRGCDFTAIAAAAKNRVASGLHRRAVVSARAQHPAPVHNAPF
ncbi:MAG: hypothetical protein ACK56F_04575, partial [bacterium]